MFKDKYFNFCLVIVNFSWYLLQNGGCLFEIVKLVGNKCDNGES